MSRWRTSVASLVWFQWSGAPADAQKHTDPARSRTPSTSSTQANRWRSTPVKGEDSRSAALWNGLSPPLERSASHLARTYLHAAAQHPTRGMRQGARVDARSFAEERVARSAVFVAARSLFRLRRRSPAGTSTSCLRRSHPEALQNRALILGELTVELRSLLEQSLGVGEILEALGTTPRRVRASPELLVQQIGDGDHT